MGIKAWLAAIALCMVWPRFYQYAGVVGNIRLMYS